MDDFFKKPVVQIGTARVDFANLKIEGPAGQHAIEPLVMAVLAVLHETPGKTISRDDLIDKVWGVSHGGDERLTRAISLLRKAFGDERGHHMHIETVPSVGYRLIAKLGAETAGADHPGGVLTEQPSRVTDIPGWNKQALAIAGAFLILLVIAWVAIERSSVKSNPAVLKSIAVLPFEPLSTGENDTYFADGLTLELTNSLATLGDLRVTGSASSFALKDSQLRIDEISDLLGVAYLVEGSIRRSGDNVRITAELVRASDQSTLWANAYDRPIGGTVDVQSEIATRIADTLNVVLDENELESMERVGLKNVDAFIEFQKAYDLHNRAHGELPQVATLITANSIFDKVLGIDATYWPAHFLSADLYTHILLDQAAGEKQASVSLDLIAYSEDGLLNALRNSRRSAANQLETAVVDLVLTFFSSDWSDINVHLDYVLNINACATYEQWTQVPSVPFGRAKEALAFYTLQADCDPIVPIFWNSAAMASLFLGDWKEALQLLERGRAKMPFNLMLERTRFGALLAAKQFDEAKQMVELFPDRTGMMELVRFHAARGDRDVALNLASELYEFSATVIEDDRPAPMGFLDDALYVSIASIVGDRATANGAAKRIDARPNGSALLAEIVLLCFCGAPFDLEATPNFAARIAEAGFTWPPYSPINYPLKDW